MRHYCGTKVSIWSDTGTLIVSQDVISNPGILVETALAAPVTLNAGAAYRVCFYTGGPSGPTYYVNSSTTTFTNGTLGSSYYSSFDAFPSIDLGLGTRYVVDLRYTVGALVAAPVVSVNPSNTTPFVNGS